MEKVTRIVGKKIGKVKLKKYMVGEVSHYHTYPLRIYTIEWELNVWVTEFRDERYLTGWVRSMTFMHQGSYVGGESIEKALNIMFAERLKVRFIS